MTAAHTLSEMKPGKSRPNSPGSFLIQVESSVDLPCVGDWVTVQYYNDDTAAIIHEVFPRKTFLRRKTAGENVDFQMIAANIDSRFHCSVMPF
ncbi:MAG: hypothetical protein MZU95_14420 [Desulfomicrobium escambiense]|nr:hypothetical protein [Desulfomicrobium escambiense]